MNINKEKIVINIKLAVPCAVVIALAVALKWYYSQAGADSLVWILAPTAWCVKAISGIPFSFEPGIGFINLDHQAIIAPVCAGINFMIISFCLISFSIMKYSSKDWNQLIEIAASLAAAFFCTIAVNALRISLAVYLYDIDLHAGWFTQERIHQLEGTCIYFISLCIIHAFVNSSFFSALYDRIFKNRLPKGQETASLLRRIGTPAVWYIAITLAVPLLLGKYAIYQNKLLEHALFVLAVPVILFTIAVFVRHAHSAWRHRRHSKVAS